MTDQQLNAIAIIPARGGSKGIPNKNLVPFAGRPLLGWSIFHALSSPQIENVFVTSDDGKILNFTESVGASPIRRPAELSGDESSSESALIHAIDQLSSDPEIVVFLQATSPLRKTDDVENALQTFANTEADSLFSGARLDDFNVWGNKEGRFESLNYDFKSRQTRQNRRIDSWVEDGSIYIFRPQILRENNNRLGGKIAIYETETWQSFEIDEPDDLTLCEILFKHYLEDCVQ